jgi:hypothetical protein
MLDVVVDEWHGQNAEGGGHQGSAGVENGFLDIHNS